MLARAAVETALRWADPLLAVVFPSRCPNCGTLLLRLSRGPLCEPCWRALPRHRAAACRCGLPLLPGRPLCPRCRRGRQTLAAGASLGPYEGSLRVVLHELKYAGRRRVAGRLAALLLEDEAVRRLVLSSEALVPVPLHRRRLRARGFNQAELLARELGRRCGVRVESVLVRRHETRPQSELRPAERRRNVRGAFALRAGSAVAGRVVTLVDDVLTTGATAGACAEVLLAAGAGEVRLLTAARA